MELWQSLLVAFGGNAALLLVLGFLGRFLMSSLLTKDLERFKADLQVAAAEHQVRFSKLHEKRAEVLAELYRLLVVATWRAEEFANPMQFAGDPEKKDLYAPTMNAIAEYFRYFDQHRVWLPQHLCGPLEQFARHLRTPTIRFGTYLSIQNPTEKTMCELNKVWDEAWNAVKEDAPKLRSELETEFRHLLGVENATPG